MLKAIRFDEEKHKDLLKWMEDFRDTKGKHNESEAVRYLMGLGLKYLNLPPQDLPIQTVKEPTFDSTSHIAEQPVLDKDSLKKELMNEMLTELNTKMLGGLNSFVDKLNQLQFNQPVIHHQPIYQQQLPQMQKEDLHVENKEPIEKPIEKQKPIRTIKPATNNEDNALLANLLGNADR